MSSILQPSGADGIFKFLRQPSQGGKLKRNRATLSSAPQTLTSRPSNLLLASLPVDEYRNLSVKLEAVRFPRNGIVYEAGEIIREAIFVNHGIASVLAVTDDGLTIEVGSVGKEGFIGLPLILGAQTACYRVVAQTRIEAMALDRSLLREEFNRSAALQQVLLHYADVLETQIIQAFVCRVAHDLKARVARWLLVITDSLDSDICSMTHEQLSSALGKHRNRIGIVTGELQKQGLIECERRSIRIVERKGLEQVACECYRIVQARMNLALRIFSTQP